MTQKSQQNIQLNKKRNVFEIINKIGQPIAKEVEKSESQFSPRFTQQALPDQVDEETSESKSLNSPELKP